MGTLTSFLSCNKDVVLVVVVTVVVVGFGIELGEVAGGKVGSTEDKRSTRSASLATVPFGGGVGARGQTGGTPSLRSGSNQSIMTLNGKEG